MHSSGSSVPKPVGVDLEDRESATPEAAVSAQWNEWLIRMKQDFDRIEAFEAAPSVKLQAWERFLKGYPEDNPLSNEDERLRREALSLLERLKAEIGADRPANTPDSSGGLANGGATARLAEANGCFACHTATSPHVGPSFADIAARYRYATAARTHLERRVRAGSRGAWGPVPMPANPELSEHVARELVAWVLSH